MPPVEGLGDDATADSARGPDDSDVHGSPWVVVCTATVLHGMQRLYGVKFRYEAQYCDAVE